MSLQELVTAVVDKQHASLRTTLPRTKALVQKLARTQGAEHPELHEVARRFECLSAQLMDHMTSEERKLFPFISAAAEAASAGHRLPRVPVASLDGELGRLQEEHDDIAGAMSKIRALTNGFAAPREAGATYRHCMYELAEFERALESALYLEGHVLFPEVRELTPA